MRGRISSGPSLSPTERGMSVIRANLLQQEAAKSRVTLLSGNDLFSLNKLVIPWGFFASCLFGRHQITAFTQPKKAGQSDKRRTPRHYRAQLMQARHRPHPPESRDADRRAVPEAGRSRQESSVLPRRSPDRRARSHVSDARPRREATP